MRKLKCQRGLLSSCDFRSQPYQQLCNSLATAGWFSLTFVAPRNFGSRKHSANWGENDGALNNNWSLFHCYVAGRGGIQNVGLRFQRARWRPEFHETKLTCQSGE